MNDRYLPDLYQCICKVYKYVILMLEAECKLKRNVVQVRSCAVFATITFSWAVALQAENIDIYYHHSLLGVKSSAGVRAVLVGILLKVPGGICWLPALSEAGVGQSDWSGLDYAGGCCHVL